MNDALKTGDKSLAEEVRKNLLMLQEQGVIRSGQSSNTVSSILRDTSDIIYTLSDEGFTAHDIAASLKTTLDNKAKEKTLVQYIQRILLKRKPKQRKNKKVTAPKTAAATPPVTPPVTAPKTAPVMPPKTAPVTPPVSTAKPEAIQAATAPVTPPTTAAATPVKRTSIFNADGSFTPPPDREDL
jgi:hypothetical protein